MKILIDIGHPAHVHLFKNFIWEMEKRGHQFLITARDKDVSIDLLKAYGIECVSIGKISEKRFGLIREWLERDIKILKRAKAFNPDILMGMLNPCIAHSAKILRKRAIIFNDSEVVNFTAVITHPFSDAIITPVGFHKKIGKKQVFISGYKELAYLHPNCFKPDKTIQTYLNLTNGEKFVLMRFVAWKASHDVGKRGFSLKDKFKHVSELEEYARVFITSESPLPPGLAKYKITFPPEKIHDALYYADLLIGDSQTMTTEAGILGTPAIRCNSWVSKNDMGNFIELEQKYGLIFNYSDPNKAIDKAIELIQKPDLKEGWQKKREKLLKDKIDVTSFMVWFVENYPESYKEMKENPEIQYRFK
jgi:predicted glycosyltransferase